ncbi:MAG: hypothetical protein DCC67_11685 [Planctomycetota bacterium]|nr:MAG: hypothetical protein DCC67_11685 [Planctomycetota bacterium]
MPSTVERVPRHTAEHVNAAIRRQTDENVHRYSAGGEEAVRRRLSELDHEWDVERTLEANAASVVLAGVALGALVDRRFFAVPAIVGAFLLQHAVQGWCPPLPILRRLGFRTAEEIDRERDLLQSYLPRSS